MSEIPKVDEGIEAGKQCSETSCSIESYNSQMEDLRSQEVMTDVELRSTLEGIAGAMDMEMEDARVDQENASLMLFKKNGVHRFSVYKGEGGNLQLILVKDGQEGPYEKVDDHEFSDALADVYSMFVDHNKSISKPSNVVTDSSEFIHAKDDMNSLDSFLRTDCEGCKLLPLANEMDMEQYVINNSKGKTLGVIVPMREEGGEVTYAITKNDGVTSIPIKTGIKRLEDVKAFINSHILEKGSNVEFSS